MKKIIVHLVPLAISWVWLILNEPTFNPLVLKGPDFLKFYLMLLFGFYASASILKISGESFSKMTFYGMIFIFILGVVKLIRGIVFEKPVVFLLMVLLMESIVFLFVNSGKVNRKMKG